jgi:nicotinamidase-related amidase
VTLGVSGGSFVKTALVIIDMQRSLFEEGPWNADVLLERISRLIDFARQAKAPIVFVRDRRVEPDARLHPMLEANSSDIHIQKNYCDTFLDTCLDVELKAKSIERLLVAGLQTDYCIDTTCRRAASLGYTVLLVSDGHSTHDQEHLKAEQIVAHHNRILRSFPAGAGSVSVIESDRVNFA